MNPATSPAAEEQAALWAARLDGSELSAADHAALDTWLAADPVHRGLLSSYCQFSADLEQQLPLLEGIRERLAETSTATYTARPSLWLRRPIWAGAMLAAVAAVAVILWSSRPQNRFQNLGAPVGARQTATLADGSQLELNAGTSASAEITKQARHVRLTAGEAFFQVTKDPARPFIVETPSGSVRVTGTQFNVRTEAGGFEVTVLDGSVQARPGDTGAARALGAGDQLALADARLDVRHLSARQLADTLAWRAGQVVFDGTPLREALQRFARYHGRNLSAADEVASLLVGGRYSLDDLDGFLFALESFLPVKVTRALDGSIRVEPASRS